MAVFKWPQSRKTCQYLDGQGGKTFLEIFGGNYNFSKFREAMNAFLGAFWNIASCDWLPVRWLNDVLLNEWVEGHRGTFKMISTKNSFDTGENSELLVLSTDY